MHPLLARFACWSLFLGVAAGPAWAEPQFPYKAAVTADDVNVRSGPGQNYYPTETLRRGQVVEVYRHDPGGWCAIRPTDGSFTWVSARYLKPTRDRLAVVTEENVSARVGSRLSNARDVVQVRLHKGEVVEILEAPREGDGGGWYKIAPPAGEFRWVSSRYLDPEYPHDGLRRRRNHDESAPAAAGDAGEAGHPPRESTDDLATRSARPRRLTPEEFQAELERIELELSVTVIDDPATWTLDALAERANVLLDEAQTAVERGRARMLANKIARFDDIRRRQESMLAMRDAIDRNSRLLSRLRPREEPDDENRLARFETDGRFDGVGELREVVAPKPGAPRYALVDASGSVRCYVTPAPGVKLHPYLGREVGVVGTRGYMPEEKTGHVMARQITPLEGAMLR